MEHSVISVESKFIQNEKSFLQILEECNSLEKNFSDKKKYILGISSNITLSPFDSYLKWYAANNNVYLDVVFGNYNDEFNDINLFISKSVKTVIYYNHFDNIMPSFEAQFNLLSDNIIFDLLNSFKEKIEILFNNYKSFDNVLVLKFHLISVNPSLELQKVIDKFNLLLIEESSKYKNIKIIDINNIVNYLGLKNSINYKSYFQNKQPYTNTFLSYLANYVCDYTSYFNSYYYKALVLDCDNTLWGGVIGEDLVDGVKISPHEYPSNIYWLAQNIFSNLEKKGVLLCLCSKNNEEDIINLFSELKMPIEMNQIILKKINWLSKSENIKNIASELNIGLDSIVFVDDSAFECEMVKSQLSDVTVFKVPDKISLYPVLLNNITSCFINNNDTLSLNTNKTDQYKLKQVIENYKNNFTDHSEFLKSLDIKVKLSQNNKLHASRVSQLSLKSNQFNLTTKRYNENQINTLINDNSWEVFSMSVSDKFGDSGITGVVLININDDIALIDSFFMSCRIIGRGIEFSIFNHIVKYLFDKGINKIKGSFIKSIKNIQVSDFYKELGFTMINQEPLQADYELDKKNIVNLKNRSEWIEIIL